MFNVKPKWKWTMDCWEVIGNNPVVKKEVSAAKIESVVKKDSGRKLVKRLIKRLLLRHMQRLVHSLLQRLVQRLLRLSTVGKTRRQTKKDAAFVYVRGKSERARKLSASQQSPFKGNNTAKMIIPNKNVGPGYDPFAPVDKKMSKVLTDWLKLDLYYKIRLDKKPCRCPSRFYHVLRTPLAWLIDSHMDAFINLLRQR
ncbi:hypothetical protein Bca101_057810 [Brassica carinata]